MNKLFITNKSIPLYIIVFSGIISCLILMISAIYMFPIPGSDAVAFIPAAVRYSSGFGLENPIYSLAFATDIKHEGNFCFYPPLFPWLVGSLMLHSTTKSAFFILGIFSSISIGLFVYLLIRIIKIVKNYITYNSAIIASLMIFSYTGMILPMGGRPELLASIFVLILAIIFTESKNKINSVLLGIFIGLLGATHIAGAIISVVILLLASAYRFSSIKTFKLLSISVLVALVAALTIITLSPNGLINTLVGIKLHSNLELQRTDTGVFPILRYWVFSPGYFFFGPIIIFSLLFFIIRSVSIYRRNNTTIIFGIALLSAVYLFYFFGFRAAPISYNFGLFQPIAYCVIIYELYKNNRENKHNMRVYSVVLSLMLLISLLSPLRTSLLFFDYLNSGKTYENARNQIQGILAEDKFIFFTASMWSLSEDYEKMWSWGKGKDIRNRKPSKHFSTEKILVQQEASQQHFVPKNARLILDWRYLQKPVVFKFPLGNRAQGYGFSLWAINDLSSQ